jgi:hypothetical protein
MEVCRETDPGSCRETLINGDVHRAWKIEYPVAPRSAEDPNPFVLRLWCGFGRDFRPFGAERVARILAPVIESWLGAHQPLWGRRDASDSHVGNGRNGGSALSSSPGPDRSLVPLSAAPSASAARARGRLRRSS